MAANVMTGICSFSDRYGKKMKPQIEKATEKDEEQE